MYIKIQIRHLKQNITYSLFNQQKKRTVPFKFAYYMIKS